MKNVVVFFILALGLAVGGYFLLQNIGEENVVPPETTSIGNPLLTDGMTRLLAEIKKNKRASDLGDFPEAGEIAALPTKTQLLEAFEAADEPLLDYDIIEFGSEALAKLGKFESFNVFQEGSQIIPITLNNEVIPSGSHQANGTCDRPPWLGLGSDGQAVPYSRVGRLKALKADGSANPDVDWCFIARRYKIRQDPNFTKFEDVAVIGHNRVTGDTAFFQMLAGSGPPKDATFVPSPMATDEDTQTKARDFWLTPQQTANINCNSCHDADPWIHSPYIDQVTITTPTGAIEPIVPRGADLATAPEIDPPYKFVGTQAFTDWPAPKQFRPANNMCVKCHRIGDKFSANFIRYSIGEKPTGQSSLFDIYPYSHTMPPSVATEMTEEEYDDIFRQSAEQLISLINNYNQQISGATQPTPMPEGN